MKFLKSKVWSPLEIVSLKLSAILFGMVAGAYFHDFTRRYALFYLAAALVLAFKPAHSYFKD